MFLTPLYPSLFFFFLHSPCLAILEIELSLKQMGILLLEEHTAECCI